MKPKDDPNYWTKEAVQRRIKADMAWQLAIVAKYTKVQRPDNYWTKEAILERLLQGRDWASPPKPPTAQQRAQQRWSNRPIEALRQDASRTRVALYAASASQAISNMKSKVQGAE